MTDKFIAVVLVAFAIALIGLGLNQAKLSKDVVDLRSYHVVQTVVVTPSPTATPSAAPTLILKKLPLRVVTPAK